MENSIYIGLSRQMALKNNLDMIANNVANLNTTGYRGQNMVFSEFISDPKGSDAPISFVNDIGQYKNTEAGPMTLTGNPLDVALAGPGFFGVIGVDGKVSYTRAGEFQIAQDGTLTTVADLPVAGNGGGRIVVPRESKEVKIDSAGFVSNENGVLGQLMIAEFQNPQSLKPAGNNTYTTDDAPLPASGKTIIKQGQLEGANVNGVIEITRMIDTLRSFQAVQQVLTNENDRLRAAIQRLTRQA